MIAPPTASLATLAALSTACSFVGVKRVEPGLPRGAQPECTSSWTLPLIDGGMAVTTGATAVILHSAASSRASAGESSSGFRTAAWTVNAVSAGFVASLAYGIYQRNRCRAAEIAAENAVPPTWLEENRSPRGNIGSACTDDRDCADDLLCGEPMKTCIPAQPAEEPPTP